MVLREPANNGTADETEIMKANNQAATTRSATAPSTSESSAEKSFHAATGALEKKRTQMSRGQVLACLRDIHRYWSTPRISCDEVDELERQNLIERGPAALCAIRLTDEGELEKKWQHPRTGDTLCGIGGRHLGYRPGERLHRRLHVSLVWRVRAADDCARRIVGAKPQES